MNKSPTSMIPVHRPLLPQCEKLMPYLQQMDASRWYSNFGPLLRQFEERLATHYGVAPGHLTTAANGTLMLISILQNLNLPKNSLCVMPSWTFVATAAAACYAGLIPYFVDVERESQALSPEVLKQQLPAIKQPIGVVIVIAPFGAPVDRQAWDAFTDETGIPVIIDAAAAFDTVSRLPEMRKGKSPTMISLHATKVFGIGEGGLVLAEDTALISRIKASTSFGFVLGKREAMTLGYNAKLSEYTAAVGLAALDEWQHTQKQWERVRDQYMIQLEAANIQHAFSKNWVSSTCNIIVPGKADWLAAKLKAAGIDTRKWWNNGCHQEKAYQACPKMPDLKNTEWLSQSVLGLPSAVDLSSENIAMIGKTLVSLLNELSCVGQKNEIPV